MWKKWTVYALALSLFVSLLVPAGQIQAADASVKVTLPNFKVSLNGHIIENQYRQYPLLVYKGITYFPMTWNDTRLLGLEAAWSQSAGLVIKQGKVTSSYAPNMKGSRNANSYNANISTLSITVSGKAINNAKEQYPLLSFRNEVYFPLTWRFAHDEFGWDYKWNSFGNLSITSHNPQLLTAGLPAYAEKNGVALFKGFYYYVETKGTTNHIYRAPVKQPSARKEIYSYFYAKDEELLPENITFQIRDHALWFTYHRGEGVLGHNVYVKIGDDGRTKVVGTGYLLDFRDTPFGTLIIDNASNNDIGNLYFLEGTHRKIVGDPGYLKFAQSSMHENGLTATSVVGDFVYVLCRTYDSDSDLSDPNIYRIDLKTNKMDKVVSSVDWFRIENNMLYYVKSEDHTLYSYTLDGTRTTKLSEHPVSWFDSIDGNLFYSTKSGEQFELYKVDSERKDPLVWKSPVTEVNVIDDKLICQLPNDDGFVILDDSGSLIAKVADPIKRLITSDELFVQLIRDSSIQLIR